MDSENSVIKNEIEHIKEDIKEIKQEQKETTKYFKETIDILKENQIQQTLILKNQEKQFSDINKDIAELKSDFDNTVISQTKWYQDFLSDNVGMFIKVLFIIILILSGAKLAGFDIGKLIGGF